MKAKLCVKKRTLLLIAGIVWMIAGFNVARLGVVSYLNIDSKWCLYLLSIFVFFLFGLMFFKMSRKHTKRILGYEDYRPFWHFFDAKAYLIMTCMMSCGIGFRAAGIFPEIFVAFFIPDWVLLWHQQELSLPEIICCTIHWLKRSSMKYETEQL